jgi:hypothetical protein
MTQREAFEAWYQQQPIPESQQIRSREYRLQFAAWNAAIAQKEAPKNFLKERAQLEQEWSAVRHLRIAYEGQKEAQQSLVEPHK